MLSLSTAGREPGENNFNILEWNSASPYMRIQIPGLILIDGLWLKPLAQSMEDAPGRACTKRIEQGVDFSLLSYPNAGLTVSEQLQLSMEPIWRNILNFIKFPKKKIIELNP